MCDINFDEPQEPCYPINHSPLLPEESDPKSDIFSLRVLGASEGFDPLAPANGYLIRVKGKWILWDCPGYTETHLKQLDLGVKDMDAVFISHVHEDHLDIVQIIRKDRPIELYAVPVVFHCILIKAEQHYNVLTKKQKTILITTLFTLINHLIYLAFRWKYFIPYMLFQRLE